MVEETTLTLVWAAILAFAVFMYVVMDGFDLGIGVLFPFFGVGKEIGNRTALDVLADDERSAVFITDVVDGDDVRMASQPSHRLRFSDQAWHAVRA